MTYDDVSEIEAKKSQVMLEANTTTTGTNFGQKSEVNNETSQINRSNNFSAHV